MQRRFVRPSVRIACAGQAGTTLEIIGIEKKYLPVKERFVGGFAPTLTL